MKTMHQEKLHGHDNECLKEVNKCFISFLSMMAGDAKTLLLTNDMLFGNYLVSQRDFTFQQTEETFIYLTNNATDPLLHLRGSTYFTNSNRERVGQGPRMQGHHSETRDPPKHKINWRPLLRPPKRGLVSHVRGHMSPCGGRQRGRFFFWNTLS